LYENQSKRQRGTIVKTEIKSFGFPKYKDLIKWIAISL